MSLSLEISGLQWLRWQKRCMMVLMERSPREWRCGRPDLLGVTQSRYLIEIEVKRTLSDFRANKNKTQHRFRAELLDRLPKLFFFLVPEELVSAAHVELPDYAGLLYLPQSGSRNWLSYAATAPTNSNSKRLSIKECIHFARLMANQNVATLLTNEILRRRVNP